MADLTSEINQMMGQSCYAIPDDVDEDELMGELDALEDDLAAEPAMGSGPSYLQVGLVVCFVWGRGREARAGRRREHRGGVGRWAGWDGIIQPAGVGRVRCAGVWDAVVVGGCNQQEAVDNTPGVYGSFLPAGLQVLANESPPKKLVARLLAVCLLLRCVVCRNRSCQTCQQHRSRKQRTNSTCQQPQL